MSNEESQFADEGEVYCLTAAYQVGGSRRREPRTFKQSPAQGSRGQAASEEPVWSGFPEAVFLRERRAAGQPAALVAAR